MIATGAIGERGQREQGDQRGLKDLKGLKDQSEESGDDLGRLTSGPGARAVSRRPTPILRAATTVLGSVKTATPVDGTIGNGIAVIAVIVVIVVTVETVETAAIAGAVTLMTDLDAVTCSTSDPDVAAARIGLTVETVEIVETEESGGGVLHPPSAKSPRQT